MKLKTRITVAHLRRLKEEGGIDFAGEDSRPAVMFSFDPDFVVMVCYHLYKPQFDKAKLDENGLAELCGPEEIEALRTEVTQQMLSFSNFWRILSTQMDNLQSGDMSLLEAMEKLPQVAPSGLGS